MGAVAAHGLRDVLRLHCLTDTDTGRHGDPRSLVLPLGPGVVRFHFALVAGLKTVPLC